MTRRVALAGFLNYLLLAGSFTVIYFLAGWLGLLFQVPSQSIGALWPPSGVALSILLLSGRKFFPSILLGSLGICIYSLGLHISYLPVYIASASGATASALAGELLIKKTIGFPNLLISGRSIALFLVLGGLVSTTLAPTLGILPMCFSGTKTWLEIATTWAVWWVGNSIGVLVFTPIILSLFNPSEPLWRQRRLTVALPLLVTFILVAGLFLYVQKIEAARRLQETHEHSVTLSQAIEKQLNNLLNTIGTVKWFFLASAQVEPKEFAFFTKTALRKSPEITSISYASSASLYCRQLDLFTLFNPANEERQVKLPSILQNLTVFQNLREQQFHKERITVVQNALEVLMPIHREHKLQGVLVATISIPVFLDQALDKLNMVGTIMTIRIFNEDNIQQRTVVSNLTAEQIAASEEYVFEIFKQRWLINFYYNQEFDVEHIDWSIEWVLVSSLFFLSFLGGALLLLTAHYYNTELIVSERTQAFLNAKKLAESANEAKSQLLAKVSHELMTPLNGILGFTNLIQKVPALSGEMRKKIAIIKNCSEDLLSLINDLLDISVIESGKIPSNIGVFDFDKLLFNILEVFKLQAAQKHLTLITHIQPLNHDLQGDKKRIRQIIVNLLNNALKYTAQGEISISTAYQDGNLQMIIQDTGCGIAQEDLEAIFAPFVQVSKVSNLSKQGVGLGLAITKELVNHMHGNLVVDSKLGEGSTFTIHLPLPAYERNLEPMNADAPGSIPDTILIADDNEINLLLLTHILELQGYEVHSARNGEEALALINKNNYLAALIDLDMPVMSGLTMVRILRQQQNNLKVFAISAYGDTEKKIEALAAGFDVYFSKPIDEEHLLTILQTLAPKKL